MTVQIGAVLLFATIIIALATYQATVVPAQNADVEYQHSQQAQNQLTDVRNALLQTAATGNTRPASVTLGTQYPSRVFLLNPPPAAGTLSTEAYTNDTIRVSNVRATNDETADFFAANGDAWSASTKYLSYQPGYHEYDGAPNLVFGATLLSNYYPDQNTSVPLTDQLLVRGNTITLVALNGSMSTSRVGSASVSATPVSAPFTAVQVEPENDGEPVSVTVPSHVDAATLANATNLGSQANVSVVDAGEGRVTIQLSGDGPFTLQTAKLGVGSSVEDEGAQYLTLVESDDDSVTVEARDRFSNPVSGVTVNVSAEETSSKTTNERGRATFTYTGSDENVTASILGGGSDELEVSFNEARMGSESDSVNWEWNGSRIQDQISDDNVRDVACRSEEPDQCTVNVSSFPADVTLYADVTNGRAFASFDVTANQSGVVGGFSPSEAADNDGDGRISTEAELVAEGTALVYAAGATGEDALRLAVRETDDPAEPIPTVDMRLDDFSHQNENSVRQRVSWDVSNQNSSFERVSVKFDNLARGASATTVINSTQLRGSALHESGYGTGEQWEATIRVVYEDAAGNEYVVQRNKVTNVADEVTPASENDDLSRAGSPSFQGTPTVVDQTNPGQGPEFQVDYSVATNGNLSEVRLAAISRPEFSGGADYATETAASASVRLHPGYGNGDDFRIKVVLLDNTGAVVDTYFVDDTAQK